MAAAAADLCSWKEASIDQRRVCLKPSTESIFDRPVAPTASPPPSPPSPPPLSAPLLGKSGSESEKRRESPPAKEDRNDLSAPPFALAPNGWRSLLDRPRSLPPPPFPAMALASGPLATKLPCPALATKLPCCDSRKLSEKRRCRPPPLLSFAMNDAALKDRPGTNSPGGLKAAAPSCCSPTSRVRRAVSSFLCTYEPLRSPPPPPIAPFVAPPFSKYALVAWAKLSVLKSLAAAESSKAIDSDSSLRRDRFPISASASPSPPRSPVSLSQSWTAANFLLEPAPRADWLSSPGSGRPEIAKRNIRFSCDDIPNILRSEGKISLRSCGCLAPRALTCLAYFSKPTERRIPGTVKSVGERTNVSLPEAVRIATVDLDISFFASPAALAA